MKKINIIVCLIILILLIGILISLNVLYIHLSNSLKLNGKKEIEINYNETYEELGVKKIKLFNKDLSKNVKIKNNINNKKIGKYKVTYTLKFLMFKISKTRTVNVVDKTEPTITLNGEEEIYICPGDFYEDEGYKAYDEYDKDITDKVKRKVDENGNIIYEVEDSSGNKVTKVRKIIREDKEPPVISLKGNSTIYVKLNSKYNDAGYTLHDNCDVNPKIEVINRVDTTKENKYEVTYKATDKEGNVSTAKRNVYVYSEANAGIVYLTFDDGPSGTGSTEKILNILKQENVKATFFVTSSGPDYLIKREYDEGHAIALHTSTHDYSKVYKSVDAFFEDLNTVKSRVKRITGLDATIIRFPGGSNNTVSNNYNYGIMDILTKEVLNRGYNYFDWNITSGDSGECTTSSCVYNNVVNRLSRQKVNMILMHDIKMFTANALSDIIKYCKNNGYTFKIIDSTTQPIRFK